jgi:hypothetical protein
MNEEDNSWPDAGVVNVMVITNRCRNVVTLTTLPKDMQVNHFRNSLLPFLIIRKALFLITIVTEPYISVLYTIIVISNECKKHYHNFDQGLVIDA